MTGGDLSRGATEVVALAGALSSFAEAAQKTLPKLAGLRVSASTAERTIERVGAEVGARLGAGEMFGNKQNTKWSKDAQNRTVAYVSADSTGVGMQGANGVATDGRMAGWRWWGWCGTRVSRAKCVMCAG